MTLYCQLKFLKRSCSQLKLSAQQLKRKQSAETHKRNPEPKKKASKITYAKNTYSIIRKHKKKNHVNSGTIKKAQRNIMAKMQRVRLKRLRKDWKWLNFSKLISQSSSTFDL